MTLVRHILVCTFEMLECEGFMIHHGMNVMRLDCTVHLLKLSARAHYNALNSALGAKRLQQSRLVPGFTNVTNARNQAGDFDSRQGLYRDVSGLFGV